MRLSTVRLSTMRLSTSIKLAVILWLVAEMLAFVLVADLIGYPETLLLAFVTSLFGWTLLKRAGASAQMKLRAAFSGRRVVDGQSHRFLDETLAGAGALALLMPGFLSDLVGLVLAVPAARDRIATWLGTGGLRPRWRTNGPARPDRRRSISIPASGVSPSRRGGLEPGLAREASFLTVPTASCMDPASPSTELF